MGGHGGVGLGGGRQSHFGGDTELYYTGLKPSARSVKQGPAAATFFQEIKVGGRSGARWGGAGRPPSRNLLLYVLLLGFFFC